MKLWRRKVMSQFENVFIFVSDALRFDYTPEKLIEDADSEVIRTLAPSHHSAKSFASIVSGLEASNHSVNHFGDKLDQNHVFEFFENSNLWDSERSSVRYMLDMAEKPDLEEMDEPFFWMERSHETHIPYGVLGHSNDESVNVDRSYFKSRSVEELKNIYSDAANQAYDHFRRHVEYLKEEGLYEDTLVIFTADHGDALGERVFGRRRYGHNVPATNIISEVPTVFYNCEIEADRMRSVDILPTALGLLGKNWLMDTDGVDIRDELPNNGECPTAPYIFHLEWVWSESKERWVMDNKSLAKALIEDHVPEKIFNKVGLEKKNIDFGD
jgi:arylsulfatase A-like enzyme